MVLMGKIIFYDVFAALRTDFTGARFENRPVLGPARIAAADARGSLMAGSDVAAGLFEVPRVRGRIDLVHMRKLCTET